MFRKSIRAKRKEGKAAKCAAMRAAKDRKRIADAEKCGQWVTRRLVFDVSFSPCGRYVGLRSESGRWQRCGSERAVRGRLASVLYGHKERAA